MATVVTSCGDDKSLSRGGDAVHLYNGKGENIDNIEFGPMETYKSWSANHDGSETFAIMSPTRAHRTQMALSILLHLPLKDNPM